MAKKCSRKVNHTKSLLSYLYDTGLIQSTVFHTVLFLILACIIIVQPRSHRIKIALDFTSENSQLSLDKIDEPSFIEHISNDYTSFEIAGPPNNEPSIDIDENNISDMSDSAILTSYNDIPKEVLDEASSVDPTIKSTNDQHTASSNIINEIRKNIGNSIAHSNTQTLKAFGQGAGGDEMGRRLLAAGAKTGDVQVSMMWGTVDDIDLYVVYTPGNGLVDNINWTNRFGRLSSGILDVDMNANYGMLTDCPVENIFWPKGSSPAGFFTVYIHFYRSWSGHNQIPVLVRIKQGNDIREFKIIAILGRSPQEISRFQYPNQMLKTKF